MVVSALVFVTCLLLAPKWQNGIRALMDMAPVESARPFTIGVIAVAVLALSLVLAHLFGLVWRRISSLLSRWVPRRVAVLTGLVLAGALFWSLGEGLLVRHLLSAANASFQQLDAAMEPEVRQPRDPLASGSETSLLRWGELGRMGRAFVASGPDAAELTAYFGQPVLRPIRVYVGLNSAGTVAARAQLALQELRRTGAFEREVLVIITPTGTGWVDPAAIDSLEYLYRGDVASVAVQYSYLASFISLLVEPEKGREAAQALFAEVYDYWSSLPAAQRPRLYLFGLSLGALNSARSFHFYDVVGEPFQGALWAGPPFPTNLWRTATAQRTPGSPAWLPRFRDSSVIRFSNQQGGLRMPGVPWGPLRIAFLQYASDPVTFFDASLLWREPDWLKPPRGPDVTPGLHWVPGVTMLQVLADVQAGDATPPGYGHHYAARDYIDAWLALTEPQGWEKTSVTRLKAHFWRRTHADDALHWKDP